MTIHALIGGRAGNFKQYPSWKAAMGRMPPGTWFTDTFFKGTWYYIKVRGVEPPAVRPDRLPNYVQTMMLVLA